MADKGKQNQTNAVETGAAKTKESETAAQENAAPENAAPGEELSIEEIFGRLDGIIRELEDGEISLEDSFKYYETGMKLVQTCGGKIDKVEKQILVLNGNGTEGLEA